MFSVKSQVVNILGLMSHLVTIMPAQFQCPNAKAALHEMQRNEHGYVLAKLYLWTPKCEFPIISTCHQILFLFNFFSNHLKR